MMNEKAFKWVVSIFRKHNVQFVVSGGLAAHVYGSPRPVRDFDFEIEEDGFDKIAADVNSYVTQPVHRHTSKAFDNTLLKLNYEGQDIDIASATGAKIFDAGRNEWIPDETDLSRYTVKNIFGIDAPIMRLEDLIAYKSKSPRPEDLIDIEAIKE